MSFSGKWCLPGLLGAALLLSACAPMRGGGGTSIELSPQQYQVRRGDTLSSIAWRYQLDYREIAKWNRLGAPYSIYPGQRLYLSPPQGYASSRPADARQSEPRAPSPGSGSASAPAATRGYGLPAPRPARPVPVNPTSPAPANWVWPTTGKVTKGYQREDSGSRGLDIAGRQGQPIVAAAPGTVVYSGSGLKGYGELIIVQHSDELISAYAHNRERFVREGQKVRQGEKIAEMGRSNSGEMMLHFEIRVNGKPVDPLGYLPAR